MRLACTSFFQPTSRQVPSVSLLTWHVVQWLNHHPLFRLNAQLPVFQRSLSLSAELIKHYQLIHLLIHLLTYLPDVVAVWSAEHGAVADEDRYRLSDNGVTGVTAVPGHRQAILANLISDGERRVLGRVPQTVSTLDLRTVTCYQRCRNGL